MAKASIIKRSKVDEENPPSDYSPCTQCGDYFSLDYDAYFVSEDGCNIMCSRCKTKYVDGNGPKRFCTEHQSWEEK